MRLGQGGEPVGEPGKGQDGQTASRHNLSPASCLCPLACGCGLSPPFPGCLCLLVLRLNRVVMEVAHERSQRFKDRTLEVLVEGINPKDRSQVGRMGWNE